MTTLAPRPAVDLRRTLGPLVVEWIEANLCHGPGDVQGQPIELDDEQVAFLCRAYELDDQGRRLVRRAVFSRPKGRAKSELAAMICCAEALGPVRFAGWDEDGYPLGQPVVNPVVLCVATEEGQTDNTFGAVVYMLQHGPISETPGLDVGLTRVYTPGGGSIRYVTARASSKDGGRETFVNFDETHLFISAELRNLVATIRRNLAKRKLAEPWSLETSTMYAPGEESVAELSHRHARRVASGTLADPGFLFDHSEGPDPDGFDWEDDDQLRAAVAQAYGPAAEWMDLERILSEIRDPDALRADSIRYFLNRPSAHEEDRFLPLPAWDNLGDGRPVPEGVPVCLGMDGSRKHDTTVVAWAHWAEDGRMDVGARVFSPRAEVRHHVLHRGLIDYEDVEEFVVDRFSLWDVREAGFDPTFLGQTAELITKRLRGSKVVEVPPNSRHMRDAYACLERLVLDGTVRHEGDPVIRAHVANTAAERGHRSEIRRLVKMRKTLPIDAVPALAIAVWRCHHVGRRRSRKMVAL